MLDLAVGYRQVLLESKLYENTEFVPHSGPLGSSVMPFSLKNVPAVFKRLMESVLTGLIHESR